MNFKKRVNGSWVDTPHYIHNTSTDTITTLPVDVYADGNDATVGLRGNAIQNGTPTPDNPIMPQGTGERTGNLFDEVYSVISGTIRYRPIFVGDGTFTLSTTTPYDSSVANLFLLSGNVSTGASTSGNGAWKNHTVTTQSVDGYVTIAYRHYSGTTSPADCQTMLNLGSTALPYEPYGYKIPISSAGQTTPVYLGEVHTVRKIKKLVFDGTENLASGSVIGQISYTIAQTPCISSIGLCSHYIIKASLTAPLNFVRISYASYNNGTIIWFELERDQYSTKEEQLAAFKQWLAQQYTNGTPVTVWYVLGTPETAVVNEPLMKIGDYADEVSNISIPTITGKDTFDIQTTLKPSEVSLSYTGWHDATVKEWDGSQWQ